MENDTELCSKDGISIKIEKEETNTEEKQECIICLNHCEKYLDVYTSRTQATRNTIFNFLCSFTKVDLSAKQNFSRYVCSTCMQLINTLEQAELEYNRLKYNLEGIIAKNKLFVSNVPMVVAPPLVKNERIEEIEHSALLDILIDTPDIGDDSEDEPLAVKKSKKKEKKAANKVKTKKKKQKISSSKKPPKEENLDLENVDNFSNGHDDIDDDDSNFEVPIEESPVLPVIKTRKAPAKKIYSCDQCPAKYSSLARLSRHVSRHSSRSRPPYICEVCGAHYKNRRACDVHIALHSGISDWKCHECDKLFPSKTALTRHIRIHTGETNYQCEQCGKSFIHTSSFKMHKLAHSGLKPHKCGLCGLALMTSSHLKRHLRVHSGEKRFECDRCGKKFSERYNLAAHARSHSPGRAPPPAAAPRVRLFRCQLCPERFERKYLLERHTGAVHGRALERPPPRPRNTMNKLLKQQAALAEAAANVKESSSPPPSQNVETQTTNPERRASWREQFTLQS